MSNIYVHRLQALQGLVRASEATALENVKASLTKDASNEASLAQELHANYCAWAEAVRRRELFGAFLTSMEAYGVIRIVQEQSSSATPGESGATSPE